MGFVLCQPIRCQHYLGTIVTVQTLESADCCVVGVGLDLQRLLEHCSEGGVGSVTGEGDLIAAQESTRSSVYQLNQSELSMIMCQPIRTKYSPEWSHHILRDHGWIRTDQTQRWRFFCPRWTWSCLMFHCSPTWPMRSEYYVVSTNERRVLPALNLPESVHVLFLACHGAPGHVQEADWWFRIDSEVEEQWDCLPEIQDCDWSEFINTDLWLVVTCLWVFLTELDPGQTPPLSSEETWFEWALDPIQICKISVLLAMWVKNGNVTGIFVHYLDDPVSKHDHQSVW